MDSRERTSEEMERSAELEAAIEEEIAKLPTEWLRAHYRAKYKAMFESFERGEAE